MEESNIKIEFKTEKNGIEIKAEIIYKKGDMELIGVGIPLEQKVRDIFCLLSNIKVE